VNKVLETSNSGLDEDTDFKPAVLEYCDELIKRISGEVTIGYTWGLKDMDEAIREP
jgi:hypothetical protein